jgi:hypothetical protein
MKTNHIVTIAFALCVAFVLPALADKDHTHKATPKGGRALAKTKPLAEFVMEKDRTVTINFYDDKMKAVAVASQTVTVIAETKDGKTTLEFEKKGDSLVSKTKMPEGEGYNVVVQFKQTADAKPTNLRFKLQTHACGECKRAEYACICGH